MALFVWTHDQARIATHVSLFLSQSCHVLPIISHFQLPTLVFAPLHSWVTWPSRSQNATVRSPSISHRSLRLFCRSIFLVKSFISTPYTPNFVQRFRRYVVLKMKTPLFVSEWYLRIPYTSSFRILTLNTTRSYGSTAPKIVRIGPFVVENKLHHHAPPHPSYTRKTISYLSHFPIVFLHSELISHLLFETFLAVPFVFTCSIAFLLRIIFIIHHGLVVPHT